MSMSTSAFDDHMLQGVIKLGAKTLLHRCDDSSIGNPATILTKSSLQLWFSFPSPDHVLQGSDIVAQASSSANQV
jgi:hypothetical protein